MKHKQAKVKMGKGTRQLAVAVAAGFGCVGAAQAFKIDSANPDVEMRWDNTVRYNLGVRAEGAGNVGNNVQFDDSEYKFPEAGDVVTNRIDLLSEFDFVWQQRHGFRISGAAWYDEAYDTSVKHNPRSAAPTSYTGDRYTDYTERYYKGPSGEFLDAFVFTRLDLGEMPLNVKLGQHTAIWGESLFNFIHGVSYAQSPVDLAKAFATPGIEAKELYRPLKQVSAQLGVTDTLAIAAQYLFDWDHFRFPEGGTYLGIIDMGFQGPSGLFSPNLGTNNGDHAPKKRGDWGISARWSPAWLDGTLGFYYRNFTDKHPALFRFTTPTTNFQQFYGEDIDLYGISLSKQVGSASVGMEVNYRKNMPLYSPLLANLNGSAATLYPNGVPSLNGNTYQARGNTLHALVNAVAVLPKASLGDMTLFDTATVLGEVAYSRLEKVTANRDMFQGVGYGVCDASRSAALTTNFRDKWDGCSTKDNMTLALSFTPTWLQAFPGIDVSAPMSYSLGVFGNSPVNSGGNAQNGSFSLGMAADVYSRYRFDLKYVGYYGRAKSAASAIPGEMMVLRANGLSTLLRDRGFFALTFKTTF